ncbi:MAG: biotin transporter BioY [Rhabdochlamydiaceae bacterium]
MEKTIIHTESFNEKINFAGKILWGCLLITLCSLIKIPFYPVSFTLHTFAISILALTQTPRQAFFSVLCYLICGSLGLPVFSGLANPLWVMGKCAGYYSAFPISAYLIARIRQKGHPIFGLLCGHALILTFGFLWLIPFFGVHIAFTKGLLFFVPSDLLKILTAFTIVHYWERRCSRA